MRNAAARRPAARAGSGADVGTPVPRRARACRFDRCTKTKFRMYRGSAGSPIRFARSFGWWEQAISCKKV